MNFDSIEHRPWKVPEYEWTVHMEWHDLLFVHWPVPEKILRPLVPSELDIDCWEGNAWIGIVPFSMSSVYSRGSFNVSIPGQFCELNVRTYVSARGKGGIWFFSLDTECLRVIVGARWNYGLPYYFAKMSQCQQGESIKYESKRLGSFLPNLFSVRYHPMSPPRLSKKGTLENWLTERYRLYTKRISGGVYFAEIHHAQWPLQNAKCEIGENTLHHTVKGLAPFEAVPLVHFAKHLEVVAWPLERL